MGRFGWPLRRDNAHRYGGGAWLYRCCSRLVTGWLALLLLASCSSVARPDDFAPTKKVNEFVAALEARNPSAVIALLEPGDWRREIGPELRIYFRYMAALQLRNRDVSIVENDGGLAIVRLKGDLAYTLSESNVQGEQPIDLIIEVVNIRGTWYLRSFQLPTPET